MFLHMALENVKESQRVILSAHLETIHRLAAAAEFKDEETADHIQRMLVPPAEPYATIVEWLAAREAPAIRPRDCETRTFFHDIPVVATPSAEALAAALSRRKGAYLPGHGILAPGALSPEQAFVTVSSVAFAAFVKFFSDFLRQAREGGIDASGRAVLARAVANLPPAPPEKSPVLARGPFGSRGEAVAAMLVLGGPVAGGRRLGRWPGLAEHRLADGRDIAVTTDWRDVVAEIAVRHLGLPERRLPDIFPGFTPLQPPLGVLS